MAFLFTWPEQPGIIGDQETENRYAVARNCPRKGISSYIFHVVNEHFFVNTCTIVPSCDDNDQQ